MCIKVEVVNDMEDVIDEASAARRRYVGSLLLMYMVYDNFMMLLVNVDDDFESVLFRGVGWLLV